jgi:hypothetical protein
MDKADEELCARIVEEADFLDDNRPGSERSTTVPLLRDARDRITQQAQEIAALREALQPFADEAENYAYGDGSGEPDLKGSPDHSSLNEMNDLLVGHLRRAQAALGDKP